MAKDEESDPNVGLPGQQLTRAGDSARAGETPGAGLAENRPGPRMVPLPVRDQLGVQLAKALTEVIAEHLQSVEQQILNQAEKVRAAMLDDLERQRAGLESIIGLFAQRLRQQEDSLSALRKDSAEVNERLDRHVKAIRSISEAQTRHAALLSQVLNVLMHAGEASGDPEITPTRG